MCVFCIRVLLKCVVKVVVYRGEDVYFAMMCSSRTSFMLCVCACVMSVKVFMHVRWSSAWKDCRSQTQLPYSYAMIHLISNATPHRLLLSYMLLFSISAHVPLRRCRYLYIMQQVASTKQSDWSERKFTSVLLLSMRH